jgi:hypothetical protein
LTSSSTNPTTSPPPWELLFTGRLGFAGVLGKSSLPCSIVCAVAIIGKDNELLRRYKVYKGNIETTETSKNINAIITLYEIDLNDLTCSTTSVLY